LSLDQGTLGLGGYNILVHHDTVGIHLAMPSQEQLQAREVGLSSRELGKHHVTQKLSLIDPKYAIQNIHVSSHAHQSHHNQPHQRLASTYKLPHSFAFPLFSTIAHGISRWPGRALL
jgi:hypothetical protein